MLMKFLKNPRRVGTVLPSSKALAEQMSQHSIGAEKIIELGAGTGPVTKALCSLHKGISKNDFISVELCTQMSNTLEECYPQITVKCSDAASVLKNIGWEGVKAVVVSSLPFRSLTKKASAEIQEQLFEFLKKNDKSWVVQFSYVNSEPFKAFEGWQWKKVKTVVVNIPPAHVWVLSKKTN